MARHARQNVVFAFIVVVSLTLAGCSATGQGGAQATPTIPPTATVPAASCAFTVDTPAALPTGEIPPELQRTLFPDSRWIALEMTSPQDGWAIGRVATPPTATFLRYHNGVWSQSMPPSAVAGLLHDLTMSSSTGGWAVGDQGVILRYTGGKWTVSVPPNSLPYMPPMIYSPMYRGALTGVSMTSATDGWAVGWGEDHSSTVPIFAHFTGGKWSVIDPATLHMATPPQVVAMVSASDGWALGAGLVARYQQGQWSEDPAYRANPAWKNLQFTSMRFVSPTEGWAVGNGVIARYCGGAWTLAHVSGMLSNLVMVSPNEGWLVGQSVSSPEQKQSGFLLHYLNGRWQSVTIPLVVGCAPTAMAMDATDDGWVLGTCVQPGDISSEITFAMHYHAGAWSFYHG